MPDPEDSKPEEVGIFTFIKRKFQSKKKTTYEKVKESYRPSSTYIQDGIHISGKSTSMINGKFIVNGKEMKPGDPGYAEAMATFNAGMRKFDQRMAEFGKSMKEMGESFKNIKW